MITDPKYQWLIPFQSLSHLTLQYQMTLIELLKTTDKFIAYISYETITHNSINKQIS